MTALIRFLFSTVRISMKSVLALVVVVSLLFNVATLTVSGLNAAISGVLSVVGVSTVAVREAAKKLRLRTERNTARKAEKVAAQKATRAMAERATLKTEKDAALLAARKAEKKLASQAAREIERHAVAVGLRKMVSELARGVSKRARRRAIRNSASVFGESIPFLGIAVITASLAFEINDACNTAKDMRAMQAALETDGDPVQAKIEAEQEFDCVKEFGGQVRVPTKQEIWETIVNSPSQSWEAARKTYSSLPEVSFSETYDWLIGSGQWLLSSVGLMDGEPQ